MRYVSHVAGFARGLSGKWPRLGAAVVAVMMPLGLWGQGPWLPAGATSGPIYYNGGNVGIGTASPTAALQVNPAPGVGSSAIFYSAIDSLAFLDHYGMGPNPADGAIVRLITQSAGSSAPAIIDMVKYKSGAFYINNSEPSASGYTALGVGGAERMRITSAGYIGIGTTNPGGLLEVNRSANDSGVVLRLGSFGPGAPQNANFDFSRSASTGALLVQGNQTGYNNILLAPTGGNVGIGTTNPQHLLHVVGTIGATQVIVSATGADYVFDPQYRLQPLSEVASYVKANRHLPDIPSAGEVEAKGVNLGEMQSKLLAKVEELTLHMIEEHDRNDRLEKQNRELQERIARLETAGVPSPPAPAAR